MNLLVVDDEPAVQRIEVRILEAAGHRCHGAGSYAEALEVVQREAIDIAVVDIRMPGESGLDLARTLQRDHPAIAVVMVTGTADFSSETEARRAGAVDYLVKPVFPNTLLAAVTRAGSARVQSNVSPRRAPRAAEAPVAPRVGPAAPSPSPSPSPASAVASETQGGPPVDRLFRAMRALGASDLHLSPSMPPIVRKDGRMIPLEQGAPPLSAADVIQLLTPIVPGKSRKEFELRRDSDFAYEIEGLCRFRGNIFMDRKGMAAVFRIVPTQITTAEQLGLSPAILELCRLRKGLVLVTGPTGSGKSTTLAALIDYINRTRSDHIITIEDPIEFIHSNQRCLINQREVHSHSRSFKAALRAALREDPDVVLIGEMRDLETTAIALETAETGHLVLGTLHTTTAASTVDRIIDQFPTGRQPQIRLMLSESLRGVIAQTLCRKVGGGRVAALEVLIVTNAISNLIRERKSFQIPNLMQVGKAAGMVTLNDALFELTRAGTVSPDEACAQAVDKDGFVTMLARANSRLTADRHG